MTILTYKQLDMIARAAPPVDEAHAPFVAAVMALLPPVPHNADIAKAIATVLASSAPALDSFGNSAPKPEPVKAEHSKAEHSKAEPAKAPPVASTKRRREPLGDTV
jgi:hypothetical protein